MGEWCYSSIHSVTLALDGGGRLDSRPCRFALREIKLGTLYAVAKREISSFHAGNQWYSRRVVTILTELPRLLSQTGDLIKVN
jgi:hypothetical protein